VSLIEKTGAEPTPSFEEQMRAAEAADGIPSDTETYGEFMEAPQPDEHGQVPASRTVEAEPAEAETPQAEQEAPAPEAVEAAPEVDKYEELNKKVGQLVNENAEYRRLLEQQAYQQQQYQQPQQYPVNQETVNYLDELAVENPQQAVQVAIQSGQPVLYERAMQSWYDQDPRAAGRYERQVEYQQLQAQQQAAIAPQLQQAQHMAESQQLEQAMKNVADRHEDFVDVIGTLDEARAQQIVDGGLPRSILTDLQGNQQAKEQVFEAIYRWVKADLGDTFKTAAAEADVRQAEENKQAKLDATVASATTTTPDQVEETEAERMTRVWKEQNPSMQSAWTGRQ
jgi:uncharacterized protein (DUF2249 family)